MKVSLRRWYRPSFIFCCGWRCVCCDGLLQVTLQSRPDSTGWSSLCNLWSTVARSLVNLYITSGNMRRPAPARYSWRLLFGLPSTGLCVTVNRALGTINRTFYTETPFPSRNGPVQDHTYSWPGVKFLHWLFIFQVCTYFDASHQSEHDGAKVMSLACKCYSQKSKIALLWPLFTSTAYQLKLSQFWRHVCKITTKDLTSVFSAAYYL